MRRSVLALTSVLGCFSDPPPADDGTTSGPTTSDDGTSSPSGDPTTDASSSSTTTTPALDTTAGTTSDDDTSSTGIAQTCGNGLFEVGELCIDDEPDFDRLLGAPIQDIALGGTDDAFGDGAIVGPLDGTTWVNWWLWDGGAAGPQVQGGYTMPGMVAPIGVAMGDIDGLEGDEILFGSMGRILAMQPSIELTINCDFTPPLTDFTLAEIDGEAGLEIVGTHAEDPFGLTAWTAPEHTCELEAANFRQKTSLVVALERDEGPSDLAITGTGASLTLGAVTSGPFGFMQLPPHAVGEGILHLTAGDVDSDGLRDDIVVATMEGIAVLVGADDGTFAQGPFLAAGGIVVDMAAGDLDGDGDDDIAIADASSSVLVLLLSDGAGSLAFVAGPDTGVDNTAIAVADTNADTAPDLVVGDAEGTVRWYLSDP